MAQSKSGPVTSSTQASKDPASWVKSLENTSDALGHRQLAVPKECRIFVRRTNHKEW